jgi:hypothetical protein
VNKYINDSIIALKIRGRSTTTCNKSIFVIVESETARMCSKGHPDMYVALICPVSDVMMELFPLSAKILATA